MPGSAPAAGLALIVLFLVLLCSSLQHGGGCAAAALPRTWEGARAAAQQAAQNAATAAQVAAERAAAQATVLAHRSGAVAAQGAQVLLARGGDVALEAAQQAAELLKLSKTHRPTIVWEPRGTQCLLDAPADEAAPACHGFEEEDTASSGRSLSISSSRVGVAEGPVPPREPRPAEAAPHRWVVTHTLAFVLGWLLCWVRREGGEAGSRSSGPSPTETAARAALPPAKLRAPPTPPPQNQQQQQQKQQQQWRQDPRNQEPEEMAHTEGSSVQEPDLDTAPKPVRPSSRAEAAPSDAASRTHPAVDGHGGVDAPVASGMPDAGIEAASESCSAFEPFPGLEAVPAPAPASDVGARTPRIPSLSRAAIPLAPHPIDGETAAGDEPAPRPPSPGLVAERPSSRGAAAQPPNGVLGPSFVSEVAHAIRRADSNGSLGGLSDDDPRRSLIGRADESVVTGRPRPIQFRLSAQVNADPQALKELLAPAASAIEQGAAAVIHLSAATAEMLTHVRALSGAAASVTARLDAWAGAAEAERAEARLGRQKQLISAAARTGLSVMLAATAWSALRYGRVWEVHAICSAERSAAGLARGGWGFGRLLPGRSIAASWGYMLCCIENMGAYSLGAVVLWHLLKASLFGSLLRPPPDALWLLDVGVTKGLLGSLAGTHVAAALGAAWLPWLALWLAWCGGQLALGAQQVNAPAALGAAAWLAVVQPVLMGVLPFTPGAVAIQGWAFAAAPPLQQLPGLLNLLLPPALA